LITCMSTVSAVNIDSLVPRPGEPTTNPSTNNLQFPEELKAVGNLPEVSAEGLISVAITTVLRLAMAIALIAMVVMGIFMVKAQGDEEKISSAKKIMLYLVIGMIIIAASFGLVSGISQFNFFQ